jgi:uncharacterized membrane protein YkgB
MTTRQIESTSDNVRAACPLWPRHRDGLVVFEVSAAVPLAVKPWLPKLSALGSVLAVVLFVTTVSFLFTTPGVFGATVGRFPAPSMTGGFLIKDAALLVISVWTVADALRATRSTLSGSSQDYAG